MTAPTNRQFLVWDNTERGAWHRRGNHGYTCDINDAARFDEATARRIVRQANLDEPGEHPNSIMMLAPTGGVPLPPSATSIAALLNQSAPDDLDGEPRCLGCGCTSGLACPGGCAWVTDADLTAFGLEPMTIELCTECLPPRVPTDQEIADARAWAERTMAQSWPHPHLDAADQYAAAYLAALRVLTYTHERRKGSSPNSVEATTLRSAFRSMSVYPGNPVRGFLELADQMGVEL